MSLLFPFCFVFYALSIHAAGKSTTSVPSWYEMATKTSQRQTAEKLPWNKKMRFIRRFLALIHFQVLVYLLSVIRFSLTIFNSSLLCPDSRTHLLSLQIMGQAQCHAERCGTRKDCQCSWQQILRQDQIHWLNDLPFPGSQHTQLFLS